MRGGARGEEEERKAETAPQSESGGDGQHAAGISMPLRFVSEGPGSRGRQRTLTAAGIFKYMDADRSNWITMAMRGANLDNGSTETVM